MATPRAVADYVHHLPGIEEAQHSGHYSGFLDLTPTRHMHYFYVESEGSPAEDPVIFWTNGKHKVTKSKDNCINNSISY